MSVTDRVLAYAPMRERDLWFEYLEACRTTHPLTYDEVEPWAWRRLQSGLRLLPKGSQQKETR